MEIHPSFRILDSKGESNEALLRAEFPEVFSFIESWTNSSETIQLKTSGSTGVPKVIEVEKSVMKHSALATLQALDLDRPLSALLALSAEYIAGKMMIVRAMVAGWKLYVVQPSSHVLTDWNGLVDFAALVPLQVQNGMAQLSKVKVVIIGGAPVSEGLRIQLSKQRTSQVYETYGMTETVSHIALKRLDGVDRPVFDALSGVHFSVDAENKLIIHAKEWGHSTLRTTDVVELLNDHQFIWLGRADFIINSGGIKINPERIEEEIERHLGMEIRIVGVPDDTLGNKLVAVVKASEYKEISFDFLTKYHQPKKLLQLSEFPQTPTQKLDRRALSQWASDQLK